MKNNENLAKDIKNIRGMLGKSSSEFADMIGLSKEEVKLLEQGDLELTQSQLLIICSIFLNTINSLTSIRYEQFNSEIKKNRMDTNIKLITNKLSEFIRKYNPLNEQQDTKLRKNVSVIRPTEPISSVKKTKTKIKNKTNKL